MCPVVRGENGGHDTRNEDGKDRAMGELSGQAGHNRVAVGWGFRMWTQGRPRSSANPSGRNAVGVDGGHARARGLGLDRRLARTRTEAA